MKFAVSSVPIAMSRRGIPAGRQREQNRGKSPPFAAVELQPRPDSDNADHRSKGRTCGRISPQKARPPGRITALAVRSRVGRRGLERWQHIVARCCGAMSRRSAKANHRRAHNAKGNRARR